MPFVPSPSSAMARRDFFSLGVSRSKRTRKKLSFMAASAVTEAAVTASRSIGEACAARQAWLPVLQRPEGRQQGVVLGHKTEGRAAQICQPRIVKRLRGLAGDVQRARAWPIQQADDVAQRAPAEPDGPLSATNSACCSARLMPCSTSVSTSVPTL